MFNPSTDELVGGDRKKTLNNAGRWSCELARISATCKYFAHEEVQKGLKRTIQGVEAVL